MGVSFSPRGGVALSAARAFSLVCSSLLVACAVPAAAQFTCGPNTAAAMGPSKAIPGDPQGRKGWLDKTQKADNGDVLEIWCLEIAGGVGNSFGYRFTPNGGAPAWLGRCAFEGGRNRFSKESTGDTDKNGKPDAWKKITWKSKDDSGGGAGDPKDDDKTAGTKDYDWEYTPADNKLKRWETLNGARINVAPDSDAPPPSDFDNLFAAALPPNPDQSEDMLAMANVNISLVAHVGDSWNYVLTGNNIMEFSPTLVLPGDHWSMSVFQLTNALAPQDWSANVTSNYVTFTYIGGSPINLSEGTISGFTLISEAPEGEVNWIAHSTDADLINFGMDGITVGPTAAPEPGSAALLAVGVCAFARRRTHRAS